MKRIFALIMAILMIISLVACASEELSTAEETEGQQSTATSPEQSATAPGGSADEMQEGPLTSAISNEVSTVPFKMGDLLSWGHINAIPVAKAGMSSDQLRQIAWDFMELALNFRWVPNSSFSLLTSRTGNTRSYEKDLIYGGMPYTAGTYNSPYMVMKYYDTETGDIDTAKMGENPGFYFGSMCISTTFWAWVRVSNSTHFGGINYVNPKHGAVMLGEKLNAVMNAAPFNNPNVYEGASTTLGIALKAGKSAMYEAYSELKLADGVVSSNKNHIMMVHHVDVAAQKIYLQHQAPGSREETALDGGLTILPAPGRAAEITFEKAYNDGYLPFTLKEFVGLDPVEDATVSFSRTSDSATVTQLLTASITANYSISDVYVQILDGEELKMEEQITLNTVDLFGGQATHREVYLSYGDADKNLRFSMTKLNPFKGKGCTVNILVRVSTGELLQAWSGTLQ